MARHVGQWFTPQTIDVRVHKILSAIDEQILGETNLDPVLKALETSKHDLFCCFRKYTSSVSAAQALTLKVQNLCLGKQQFLARSTTLVAKPFGILVDPANGCNLACPGCVHSHTARERGLFDWKPAMLSESRMSALLARFGPCAIQTLFCNYGEPLLNPITPKFARLAKSYLMQTVLSTNLALPHFDADAYVRSGLDYMILSIDGATQAVYERFRKKGKIQIVFDNIQKLVEARLRTGKRTPVLCWQYLAFDHNAHEIPHAIETARCLGLDVFQIASPFDVGWDEPGVRPAMIAPSTLEFSPDCEQRLADNWDPFPGEIETKTIEREFEIGWGEKATREPQRREGSIERPKHTCHWLYKSIVMDGNGRIFPCAAAPGPGRDLTFATFPAADAGDPFNSAKHRLARLSFANKEAYQNEKPDREPYCVNCSWNQTKTDIDNVHVGHYLKSVGNELFNADSIRILCSW